MIVNKKHRHIRSWGTSKGEHKNSDDVDVSVTIYLSALMCAYLCHNFVRVFGRSFSAVPSSSLHTFHHRVLPKKRNKIKRKKNETRRQHTWGWRETQPQDVLITGNESCPCCVSSTSSACRVLSCSALAYLSLSLSSSFSLSILLSSPRLWVFQLSRSSGKYKKERERGKMNTDPAVCKRDGHTPNRLSAKLDSLLEFALLSLPLLPLSPFGGSLCKLCVCVCVLPVGFVLFSF